MLSLHVNERCGGREKEGGSEHPPTKYRKHKNTIHFSHTIFHYFKMGKKMKENTFYLFFINGGNKIYLLGSHVGELEHIKIYL
jgi:hypothetical protein